MFVRSKETVVNDRNEVPTLLWTSTLKRYQPEDFLPCDVGSLLRRIATSVFETIHWRDSHNQLLSQDLLDKVVCQFKELLFGRLSKSQ